MKKISLKLMGIAAILLYVVSCSEPLTFSDTESPNLPKLENASAQLLWIGPDYKAAVQAELKDDAGITKIQLKNGEWQLDTVISVDNLTSYTVKDTFLVKKDVNPTKHTIEITITNSKGGIIKGSVDVEDLSAENQIEGYNPDLLPPAITMIKPTVTKFLGFGTTPVVIDIEADITDEAIATIEVKVWGETADGQPIAHEEIITPANDAEKTNYHVAKTYNLPAGKVGQYQYIIRSLDVSGNKKTVGGNITVGFIDRLYLSDAENEDEVLHQGYDHYGAARGIGTLLSMKKQGANSFTADFYYPNKSSDNIRFIAFMGSERPFVKDGSNQAKVNYTLTGPNVIAMSASEQGKLTTDLGAANFKLPASQNGYYHITVDMTARTISVSPYSPALPADAVKYPSWTDASPWPYMAVTGPTLVGGGNAWTEVATSPKLARDPNNKYLFTGSFQTMGTSSNMSLNAPLSANSDVWGKGWFRLPAGRSAMKDDYGDLVTKIGPVGPSGGGAGWGFSTSPIGTYKASYDLILERFRIVRTGN